MDKSNNANKKSWWHTLLIMATDQDVVTTAATGLFISLRRTAQK